MELSEVRQSVSQLVTDWYETCVPEDARQNIKLSQEELRTHVASTAKKFIDELNGHLVASDGVDEHKVAAAIGFAICHHWQQLFIYLDPASPYSTEKWRKNCYVDCALTAYLSLLLVDRTKIEAETKTMSALKDLFALVGERRMRGDNNLMPILFLSTQGFLLERVYPE